MARHWQQMQAEDLARRFNPPSVRPQTRNQESYQHALDGSLVTLCLGPAGTGKTLLACASACRWLREGHVDGIILTRPLVPCGDRMGFLPGTAEDKTNPYVAPVLEAMGEVTHKGELTKLRQEGKVRVVPLELMRGLTFKRVYVICDEAENATFPQLRMLLTRYGEGCRMVLAGDPGQSDLAAGRENPFRQASSLVRGHEDVSVVWLTREDVLRHPLVAWLDERMSSPGKTSRPTKQPPRRG